MESERDEAGSPWLAVNPSTTQIWEILRNRTMTLLACSPWLVVVRLFVHEALDGQQHR